MSEIHWTIIGWLGTAIFVASFLVKNRGLLHLFGLFGCVVKLAYTWHYDLWPLAANWVLLIGIEAVQWWRHRSDGSLATLDDCINCQK